MNVCECIFRQRGYYQTAMILYDAPRKAVGDMAPFRMETRMVIPVSMKGTEKKICSLRSWVTLSDVITMSTFSSFRRPIKPVHFPLFCGLKKYSTPLRLRLQPLAINSVDICDKNNRNLLVLGIDVRKFRPGVDINYQWMTANMLILKDTGTTDFHSDMYKYW